MDPQSFSDLEKKFCEIFGVYHLMETARKYDQPIFFFLKEQKKSRIAQYYFFLLFFHLVFMRPQTFELSKKYGFSQITFFKKVKETKI
jgi:hypothetical protein